MGCQNHSYTLSGVDKCAFYGEFHGTGHTVSNLNVDIVADARIHRQDVGQGGGRSGS